jgi:hypothetical protein
MTTPKVLPDLAYINQVLAVCKTSPTGLRWLQPRPNGIKAGDPAGFMRSGYYCVWVARELYRAARMVHYITYGVDPGKLCISSDARLSTWSQLAQARNAGTMPKSSKYKGVCWHKRRQRWVATITLDGRRKHLGYFTVRMTLQ